MYLVGGWKELPGQILDKGSSLVRDPATTFPTIDQPLEGIDLMAMVYDLVAYVH